MILQLLVLKTLKHNSLFSFITCDTKDHPMKDITNGKHVRNTTKATPNKPRKSGSISKTSKVSASTFSLFPIPTPNIPPQIVKGINNPFFCNNAATYGHFPPENESMNYSDFALTTLEQAASIPQEDYSVDFDNDEAPMAADISSSKDEDMILS